LGKGPCAAVAKEGALLFKELINVNAEGLPSGELKHGALALINVMEPKTLAVIIIILKDYKYHESCLALSEVQSRFAFTVVISDTK